MDNILKDGSAVIFVFRYVLLRGHSNEVLYVRKVWVGGGCVPILYTKTIEVRHPVYLRYTIHNIMYHVLCCRRLRCKSAASLPAITADGIFYFIAPAYKLWRRENFFF